MNGSATNSASPRTALIGLAWIASLVFVGLFFYQAGKNEFLNVPPASQLSPTPAESVLGLVQNGDVGSDTKVDLEAICPKSGVIPKDEYLVKYIIQEGDSMKSIAQKELGDETRVSEIITLNEGAQGIMAGSTVYLPPPDVAKSTGKLALVAGRIVRLDNAVWQISYGGGVDGLGLAIPAYYFSSVTNKADFKLGDCVTIFLDDGVKVFTVTKQS
ncbi:MAG: hypothetical protein KA035_00460 [Candidatus Levybacteria bacterium]|nr:hypothetical protein [Candidatus Levybacteria bacterium]